MKELETIMELIFSKSSCDFEKMALLIKKELAIKSLAKQIEKEKKELEKHFSKKIEAGEDLQNNFVNLEIIEKRKFSIADNTKFNNWCYANGYDDKVKIAVPAASMRSIVLKQTTLPEGIKQENIKELQIEIKD